MARGKEAEGLNGYVVVGEYLKNGQAIWDQPPYSFVLSDERILPTQAISNEEGEVYFLRACAAYGRNNWIGFLSNTPGFDRKTRKINPNLQFEISKPGKASLLKLMLNSITTEYRERGVILGIRDCVVAELEKYPFSIDYLNLKWEGNNYDMLGYPKDAGFKNLKRVTYASYANSVLHLQNNTRFIGLEELLPDSSAAQDILDAIPNKGRSNRVYRLIRTSEALK